LLERHGCCVVKQVAPESMVAALADNVDANYRAYRAALDARGDDFWKPFAYAEIVHRAHRRFDMQLGGVAPVPLAEELLTHAPWIPMIEAVLGARQRLFFYGAVVAEPDAQTQQKHMDGGHLFHDTHGSGQPHVPAHCVNIFLPLVDVADDTSLGPTEFWPGSHIVGAPHDGDGVPLAGNRGDMILFDYRVIHRGMANQGARNRPVLYATHTRPWFSDVENFPAERLIEPRKSPAAGAGGFGGGKAGVAAKAKKPPKKKR